MLRTTKITINEPAFISATRVSVAKKDIVGDRSEEMDDPPESKAAPEEERHWALCALVALRKGDVGDLEKALQRDEAKKNTVTANGGYGGFRFVSWGSSYGGKPDGESLLHLAVRPENMGRPQRFEIVEKLIALGVDPGLRNADDRTARDLHPALLDAAYPVKQWSVAAVVAWAESAATIVNVQAKPAWLHVFRLYRIDGPLFVKLWKESAFCAWVDDHLSDLTRHGVPSLVIPDDLKKWLFALATLRSDMKHATRLRKTHLLTTRPASATSKSDDPSSPSGDPLLLDDDVAKDNGMNTTIPLLTEQVDGNTFSSGRRQDPPDDTDPVRDAASSEERTAFFDKETE